MSSTNDCVNLPVKRPRHAHPLGMFFSMSVSRASSPELTFARSMT